VYLLLIVLVEKRKTGEHLAAKVVSISLYYTLKAIHIWFSLSNFEQVFIILLGKSSKASETYHALLGKQTYPQAQGEK
jgi:hypothetical protein